MYENILYLTAFEKFHLDILACILNFKKVGTKKIVLVHVIHAQKLPKMHEGYVLKLEEELKTLADAKMEEAAKIIQGAGMSAEKRIEVGVPYREILKVAQEEKVSLIVSGRERKGFFGEIFVGSITDKIIRHGSTPVYVPKYPGVMGAEKETCARFCERLFTRVLYPTDWSDCARAALQYIKGLKAAGVEEVVIAHIMDEKAMKLQTSDRFKEFKRIDMEKLAQVKDELEREGFRAKIHLSMGNPRAEVIRVATKEDVSLIVVGSHGKGRAEGILWGSVSRNIAEYSDRPVLLIRDQTCNSVIPGNWSE